MLEKLRIKEKLLLLPLVILLVVFFVKSLSYIFMSSLKSKECSTDDLCIEAYSSLFSDSDFIDSLIYTTKTTMLACFIGGIFSIGIIYIFYINLRKNLVNTTFLGKVLESPLLVPYLIGTYVFLAMLSPRGLVSDVLLNLKLIESYENFPILTNDKNGVSMLLLYSWKSVGFILAMTMPLIIKVERKWRDLRKVLRMSDENFFFQVLIPIIAPTLLTSLIIIFTYIFTSFETPYILGVTSPKMLSIYAFQLNMRGGIEKRSLLMASNVVITLFSIGFSGVIYFILNKFIYSKNVGWE